MATLTASQSSAINSAVSGLNSALAGAQARGAIPTSVKPITATVSTGASYNPSASVPNFAAQTGLATPTSNTAITSSAVQDASPYNLPSPPKSDFSSILNTVSAGNTPAVISSPTTEQGVAGQMTQNIKDYLGILKAPPNLVDIQNQLESKYQIEQKQQAVNTYQAQLNNIVNSAKAQTLSLEAQGRGQTTGFIGGEQARIQREAAIQALPVQAQLSAAQGDLQMAQAHVDKLFDIYAKDAQNQVDFYNKQASMLYDFVDKQSQQRLASITKQKEFQQSLLVDKIKTQNDFANTALQNGETAAFSAITNIQPPTDLNSPTYAQDYARYEQNLNSAISKYSGAFVDKLKQADIAYKNAQIASANRANQGGGAGVDANGNPVVIDQKTLNSKLQASNDIENLLANENFDNIWGIGGYLKTLIPGSPANLAKSQAQQVIETLALAARGQLKGQGTVSDFEGKMLKQAQTALNFNLNAEQARKELIKVKGAIRTSSGLTATVKLTDPKTKTTALVETTQDGINKAISDGLQVEYQ